jgi:putative Mg2+ transporter-C (MgtC) family protein
MLTQILVQIVIAGIVGMMVGIITSRNTTRMFSIICMGAALLTVISTEYYKVLAYPWYGDPGRLSAQMVSALGFLGTGLIWISERNEVQGLSVAASLWLTAILGMLVGAGLENVSAAALFIVIAVYVVSGFIKRKFFTD